MGAYVLDLCRGMRSGCRCALPVPEKFGSGLERVLAAAPSPEAFSNLGRPPLRHERFRIAVCACPNGCTRPHVADLGIIASRRVAVSPHGCTGCGACAKECPDGAIFQESRSNLAVIDRNICLGCGKCAEVCVQQAILSGPVSFRILLGGRLGRHPRLGQELHQRQSPDAALALTGRCLEAYSRQWEPGMRFSDLVSPGLQPGLPSWILP